MTLEKMAMEYRKNLKLLEGRLMLVLQELSTTTGLEKRRKLKHRIGMLHILINESRAAIFTMEHYYDKETPIIERKCV